MRGSGLSAPKSPLKREVSRTYSRTNNRSVFGMKIMAEKGRFQGGTMAPDESKFEKPLIGSFRETTVRAHFGRKLQKIFPLPCNSSEPENVRILLRKIQAKLDKPPVPGDE